MFTYRKLILLLLPLLLLLGNWLNKVDNPYYAAMYYVVNPVH